MRIRERHRYRSVLRFHCEVVSIVDAQTGRAGSSGKATGRRNYCGQFGRIAIPNAPREQSIMVHTAGSVATSIRRGRAFGLRATLTGAKRRTARRNDESHERDHAQKSQRPRRVPNSPRLCHSFVTLRPRQRRVNRTVARRQNTKAFNRRTRANPCRPQPYPQKTDRRKWNIPSPE